MEKLPTTTAWFLLYFSPQFPYDEEINMLLLHYLM